MGRAEPDGRLPQAMATRKLLESALEELAALKECLATAGLVSTDRFDVALHRQRFRALQRAHPCAWDKTFDDVSSDDVTVGKLIDLLDEQDVQAFRITSPSIKLSTLRAQASRKTPNFLYACGGGSGGMDCLSSAERFNPTTGQWETLPPMTAARLHAVCVVIADHVYVCGGTARDAFACSYTASAERFDASSGRWEVLPPMSVARGRAIGEVIDGCLYVCGGSTDTSGPACRSHCSAERLDPKRGHWETLPSMLDARRDAISGVVAGCLYVAGGSNGEVVLKDAECFEPGQATWQRLPPMATARQDALSCVLDKCLYVCGGITSESHDLSIVDTELAERFCCESQTWQAIPPMASALNRYFSACSSMAGSVYVFGSSLRDGIEAVAQRFNPECGHWEAVPQIPTERIMPLTFVIGDCLYVCGGHDFQSLRDARENGEMDWAAVLCSAECFDPVTMSWTTLPSMQSKRTLLAKNGAGVLVCLAAMEC